MGFELWLFQQRLFEQWLFEQWLFEQWLFEQWLLRHWLSVPADSKVEAKIHGKHPVNMRRTLVAITDVF
jgi:hypothetical protein